MNQIDSQASAVLRHYPRIYIACHTDHRARRGQGQTITARDQTILAHVPDNGARANVLTQHLDIAASTLSAALKRLARMKLIVLETDAVDARGRVIRLTAAGRAALAQTSVLDIERVCAALKTLSARERDTVVAGLGLLADAAQAMRGGK